MTGRARGTRLTAKEREAILPRVAEMLRAGQPYSVIAAEVGVSLNSVSNMRWELGIPLVQRSRRPRTVAETLALYSVPYGDGHIRWTGPTIKGVQRVQADGLSLVARRVAFEEHHGRRPDGVVTVTCTEPDCIAGLHLADGPLPEAVIDAQVAAIFGTSAEKSEA